MSKRDWDLEKETGGGIHWLRLLAGGLVVLILLGAVGATGGMTWLKHAMRMSLPQLDGDARLPGLSAQVTVRRDQHGVPHIEAATLDDLFEAQGYVTAQDRLWQMDMARRNAAGELAELLGSKLVDHDRLQRVLQMRATAERITATLSDRDRRYLEDYARGVNAFVDANRDRLPAEFRLLHYQPKLWQPVDSMLVGLSMVQILDQHWDEKLNREHIQNRLGPTLAAELYPTGSWRDHPPTAPAPDLTAPQENIPDVPLDETQSSLEDLLRLRQTMDRDVCGTCTPGSNEWVVSGAHTASGRAMLANDMHLEHNIPNIWYETDLKSGDFHVAGVTVPGMPYITAGHNDHIAWGYTSLYGDTQDLYVEQTNGQGDYLSADGWHPLDKVRERIKVRFGNDVVVEVESTDHGPLITPLLPHEGRAISLRWSAYDPKVGGFPLYDLNAASNWADFRKAVSTWWGPTLNMVYADDQGHIGYQATGAMPLRPNGLSGVPIADRQHEWQGYVPFDALPSTLDPATGLIATANSRITPDGYAYPLTLAWASPYRNERIWKWLAGKDKLTRDDMLTLQTDVFSELDQELAQKFAYAIDHTSGSTAQMKQAADLLRTWDGVLDVNSSPAAIVLLAKQAFWPLLLKPKLGDDWKLYVWPESLFAQEELVMHAPAQWLPQQYRNWDELLAAAVKQGLEGAHAPADLAGWHYGSIHVVEVKHPLYGMLPFFKQWTGTGAQPQSGDTSTVKQVGRDFGPSQRLTVDWNDIDGATENIVMGQSGNPLSPYYRDQWPYWYSGHTFSLPFTGPAVEAATAHTLRLEP
jgi:penicillin G amidase